MRRNREGVNWIAVKSFVSLNDIFLSLVKNFLYFLVQYRSTYLFTFWVTLNININGTLLITKIVSWSREVFISSSEDECG